MTREEILAMKPGREMDALVAEKVMGLVPQVDFGERPEHEWERDEDGKVKDYALGPLEHAGPSCVRCSRSFCRDCDPGLAKALREGKPWAGKPCVAHPQPYSTTWNGAGLVAERMAELGWNLELEVLAHSKRARIQFWRRADGVYSSSGFTLPLPVPEAMCKAALIAELGLSGVTVSSV